MSTEEHTDAAGPNGSGLSDQLGPLPEPTCFFSHHKEWPVYSKEEMRAYAEQEVSAARERFAKLCEALVPKEPNCVWEAAYKSVGEEMATAIRRA
jgi:hypothetical protein